RSEAIKIPKRELLKVINNSSGDQVMIDLEFAGGEKKLALLKDYQVDPVKGELLHTDFFEISLTEEVRVTVHVTTSGEPVGVKRDGGMLRHLLREVEVECLPDRIPGKIRLDIAAMEVGQSIHIGDLKFEEGIKVLTDVGDIIVTIIASTDEEADSATGAEATSEASEPELIKKGKKEEEATGSEGK
ncbi:MAG: 50S ribosomal protein L25, partial [Nitrospirota bacterium]|nr:50S ribosomal protein L25 [Nitrospirota bacterium]